MDKIGLGIGVIGGLGLGLLLGSEFSGSYVTYFGAILIVISLISMGVLSYKKKYLSFNPSASFSPSNNAIDNLLAKSLIPSTGFINKE